MNLLLTLVLSAVIVAPNRPIGGIEADSASVAYPAEVPELDLEDALALLQAEHHFSFPILLVEAPTAPR
jgi:hypothetical protein